MSTPAAIAVKNKDGSYSTIYCHWDGYPEYMYPLLRDWYDTEARAHALVSYGDASQLNKRLLPAQDSNHSFYNPEEDVCIFYHRDRGESWDWVKPYSLSKEQAIARQYYAYIFEDGNWHVYIGKEEAVDYGDFDN